MANKQKPRQVSWNELTEEARQRLRREWEDLGETEMQTYSTYRPTIFDQAGAFLDDRQDWLVVPVGQTRDSGPFDLSNFAAALELLGGEGDDCEVHRFGHWGPGWFEIIIVRPNSAAHHAALNIEHRLEDYPLLDEEDFSRREWEDYESGWESYGAWEFVRQLRKGFS